MMTNTENPARTLESTLHDNSLSREETLKKVCQSVHQQIPHANLISLWRFNSDRSSIISLVNYDATSDTFSSNVELKKSDFPSYFQEIVENELIVASEARRHPATRCFKGTYFEPNDIHSLLDFILHKDYSPVGVICCESKGKQANWTQEDIENIRMIAVMISFFFEV